MEKEQERFAIAVALGFIVMILFAAVTVNILDLIPLAGPFAGGIVAGYVMGKDYLAGGKAGLAAGLAGAVVVSVDLVLNTGILQAMAPHFRQLAGVLVVGVAILYFPVLGFIGGAIGGMARR